MQHDGNIMVEITDIEIYSKDKNITHKEINPYCLLLDMYELLQPLTLVLKWKYEGAKPAAASS